MPALSLNRRQLLSAFLTGLSCFVLALAALELTRLRGGVALLWIANAPLLAVLATTRSVRWPPHLAAYAMGLAAATLLVSPMWRWLPVYVSINLLETCLAAALLRRWRVSSGLFESGSSVAMFVLAAGVFAPALVGTLGAGLASLVLRVPYAITWYDWLLAHGLGNLIGTPLAMLAVRREGGWARFQRRAQSGPALVIVLGIVATTAVVFSQNKLPILFLPVVPLLVATFLYHRIGAAVGIVLIAAVGGYLTLHGAGPVMLIKAGEAARLQFFDFYLAVLFLIALPVAAALANREQLLGALSESETRYRLLADNATDIMLTLSREGRIRFASPSIRELGFFEPQAVIGRHALELIHPDDAERVAATHREAVANPDTTHTVEYRAIRADGSQAWFETNTRAVANDGGIVDTVVCVIRNLDRRKLREDELIRAATTDPLTGLLNRAAFRRAAMEAMSEIRRGRPSTLAVLDLDHFKRVNDNWGHATGDAALLMLADLLRENLRPADAIGRLGGEEFAILFRGLNLAAAAPVCERLCTLLEERELDAGATKISITMSIGVAELCTGFGLDPVFEAADQALYRAKAGGRNQIRIASDVLLG